jgi:hypothetical protein
MKLSKKVAVYYLKIELERYQAVRMCGVKSNRVKKWHSEVEHFSEDDRNVVEIRTNAWRPVTLLVKEDGIISPTTPSEIEKSKIITMYRLLSAQ